MHLQAARAGANLHTENKTKMFKTSRTFVCGAFNAHQSSVPREQIHLPVRVRDWPGCDSREGVELHLAEVLHQATEGSVSDGHFEILGSVDRV